MFRLRPTKDDRIRKRGEKTTGRIVGIRVRYMGSSDEGSGRVDDLYAIEVSSPTPIVLGIRQSLTPPESVRLGMEVVLWSYKGKVVIDWKSTCGGDGHSARWKALRRPPEPGIDDEMLGLTKAKSKGGPATATIRSAEYRKGRLGMNTHLHLGVSVEPDGTAAYDTEVAKALVPFYASHLCEIGERLPAWVRRNKPDDITIDWPAAAVAKPGIGQPASEILISEPPTLAMGSSGGMGAGTPASIDMTGPGLEPIEGIDFDRWVEIQAGLQRDRVSSKQYDEYTARFGLAPGAWLTVDRGWQTRLMKNPRLGPAYGAAMEEALKKQ